MREYDATPASTSRGQAALRWVLWIGGAALLAFGVLTALTTVPSTSQRINVLLWLAGGVVVHDAVLVPLALLVGVVVLPRVPPSWRPALRGGLLALAVLGIVAVALVAGAATRANPSVVPQDVGAALALAGIVLVVGVLVGMFLGGARRPR
ncbi:hypothetical protein CLV28_2224 [Sediminihabitans luteus]|uniref:Uncharacterized protein n=1 Tax=Sediminihabitans luteus TaxID=1138585 RepID=A0A2M9CET1_9CELL|nr:hypothetical protein [Sediminihabitans luteus]PJJ70389.1 hypothetical protein CLV28_2224 [Sediminihabitans luteus]GII97861.1 hypothetical protein Slu03_02390 [Sediminihabitans luteus]